MKQFFSNATAASGAIALLCLIVAPPFTGHAGEEDRGQPQQSPAPTEAEIHALGDRIITALHNDDALLEEYERTEHHTVISGSDRHIVEDKTFRVVPTGTGTLRILVKDGGKPVDTETYRKQLNDWEQDLELASNPKDPRVRAAYAKQQKKMKERRELVEAARQAFHATWAGREMRDGRQVDVIALEPNPNFEPHTIAESVLTHARAKIWVDDASGNIVHGEAEIIRDVYFGGGILGKLYRGGRFSLDNIEVAHGFWAPARAQFDYSGRKFVFIFESHEITETSKYRHVGSPSQALAIVKNELAHGAVVDP